MSFLVRGPVDPLTLGFTLTHEHLSLDFHHFYVAPPPGLEVYVNKKITLQNVGYVRQYPYSSAYNVNFEDDETHDAVLKDVMQYKACGGSESFASVYNRLNSKSLIF